ncbi:hypothetical protein [Acinetobacter sp. B51(2017)]|uniref:hypothetical protein n=1 Tax=Acinetobacter sp. B51(2017) TaxID=2060938 RepID=UPI000F076E3B|nr:hypothetical protein [Acinetobacter sp. B51(2017)]
MHTALGAIATGGLEGALVTGGIAGAAPQLNDVQRVIVQSLTNKGMKQENAEAVINSVTSLALISIGLGSGLSTASIGSAVNVDSNNR